MFDFDNHELVSGKFILNIIHGLGDNASWVFNLIKNNNLPDLQPNKDYPVLVCLQILETLKHQSGPNTLFRLGIETSKRYKIRELYSNLQTPHDLFPLFNLAYSLNIKTYEDINYYYYEKKSENQVIFRSQTPFHCEFERGFFTGILNHQFSIPFQNIEITHLPELACRNYGNSYCNYLITWS